MKHHISAMVDDVAVQYRSSLCDNRLGYMNDLPSGNRQKNMLAFFNLM